MCAPGTLEHEAWGKGEQDIWQDLGNTNFERDTNYIRFKNGEIDRHGNVIVKEPVIATKGKDIPTNVIEFAKNFAKDLTNNGATGKLSISVPGAFKVDVAVT